MKTSGERIRSLITRFSLHQQKKEDSVMKAKGSFLKALFLMICGITASLIAIQVSGRERIQSAGQTQPPPQAQPQSGQSEKSERPRRVTTATKSDATKVEPTKEPTKADTPTNARM